MSSNVFIKCVQWVRLCVPGQRRKHQPIFKEQTGHQLEALGYSGPQVYFVLWVLQVLVMVGGSERVNWDSMFFSFWDFLMYKEVNPQNFSLLLFSLHFLCLLDLGKQGCMRCLVDQRKLVFPLCYVLMFLSVLRQVPPERGFSFTCFPDLLHLLWLFCLIWSRHLKDLGYPLMK